MSLTNETIGQRLGFMDGEWLYEDELPEGYPYDEMYPLSKLGLDGRGGVRIFPRLRAAPGAEKDDGG